ncbi:MAG: halocyanin domain-containing protein [Halobacteriales archaeon]|nr:halocyanin domain-containing protein [Halobacteriales archaeon]
MQRREFLVLSGVTVLGATTGCIGGEAAPEEPEYDDWFSNVPHFDGFEDHTDDNEVRVMVGAGDNGFLFDPPAITVTPGTTVVWEWTGVGGEHVVAETNGDWQNPQGLTATEGHTWSREFSESDAGTHLYECWPHTSLGMKGGVFVDAHAE